jgi:CRISPR system Cascade subunit CasC
MATALHGHVGTRTQRIGEAIRDELIADGADRAAVDKILPQIAAVFGKLDAEAEKKGAIRIRQLAFISPEEKGRALEPARRAPE